MTTAMLRRAASVSAMVAIVLVASASPATADPAGPTDYRTEIIGIEPDVDGISLEVIGGDSFVELTVEPGVEVTVIGYRAEGYLRFDADGSVYQNERSPSRWLNDDRFGGGEIPPDATPDAEALWILVADDGQYAWHDHRSHWMNEARPPAAEPGDVILEDVISLVVSGVPVDVIVRSTWVEAPGTAAPLAVGSAAALGLGVGLIAAARRGRVGADGGRREGADVRRATAVAVMAVGAPAAVLGIAAYTSVPAETGPSPLLWVLPVVAVVAAGIGAYLGGGRAFAAAAATAVAALALAIWGWLRREAIVRAIIPTDAPWWLDRMGIATALAVGSVAVLAALWAAATPPTPTPERSR